MQITEKELNELEKIWLIDHPGQKITREELIVLAERIINITRLVYRPIPE